MGGMRLLVITHEFPPIGGGASPVAGQLARELAARGHQVDVLTMRFGELDAFEIREDVQIYRMESLRRRQEKCTTFEMGVFLLGAGEKARKLTKNHHYDLIHAHFLFPAGPLAWLLSQFRHIPAVVTCHGSDVPGHNPERFVRAHRLLEKPWNFLARRLPLISPSAALRQKIVACCPEAQVTVIPNGISLEALPAPGTKAPRILMAGRMLRFKGYQHALAALEGIAAAGWEVHLLGDGDYLPALKEQAQRLKLPVRFWGWLGQKDPRFRELFATSSIFIQPSEMENFPTALLEAMAAGMAVITSTAGGCLEAVGEAALTAPPGDVGRLREHLTTLMKDEGRRAELMAAGRQRVEQFRWENVAGQYLQYFQKLIDSAS